MDLSNLVPMRSALPAGDLIPDDRREDPVFHMTGGEERGRDGSRVPIPWTTDAASSYGFSARTVDGTDPAPPWLPQPAGWGAYALSEQDGDEDSMLELYRALIAARREYAVPQPETATVLDLGEGLVAARRGDLVAAIKTARESMSLMVFIRVSPMGFRRKGVQCFAVVQAAVFSRSDARAHHRWSALGERLWQFLRG